MKDIIYLDLNEVEIFGWEGTKGTELSDLVISKIEEGIKEDDDFPEVLVIKIDDKTYCLCQEIKDSQNLIDGGHHRTYAHYLTKKKLKCKSIDSSLIPDIKNWEPIKNWKIKKDEGEYNYRINRYKNYR